MPVQEPLVMDLLIWLILIKNKNLGGKRSSPQEQSELRKETIKEKTMRKCPQCEFVSQNETYFNEHMSTVHAKLWKETEQENVMRKCPQCDFISQNETYFNDHMTKVHSGQPFFHGIQKLFNETAHRELKKNKDEHITLAERKKPCL